MLTAVPFFKEVIVSSFACDNCGYKNSEVTFGGKLADFGVKMECKIVSQAHLNRLVVKSEYASIKIPELNLDIPPRTQKGSMNSVEGILKRMIDGLEEGQELRKESDPESYEKIQEFIKLAKEYATGTKLPLTIILDDPSGNSYIQNPYAPSADPYNKIEYYIRSKDQLIEMGYSAEGCEEEKQPEVTETKENLEKAMTELGVAKKEESEAMKTMSKSTVKKHVYTGEEIKELTKKLQEINKKQKGNSNGIRLTRSCVFSTRSKLF
jgi:zinc finger protein